METTKSVRSPISREKFSSFVSGLLEGYPNPEGEPQPPAPWDPLIRQAFEKVFGPVSGTWRMRFESADEKNLLMGGKLVRYSKTIANETLGHEFRAAGENLIDAGLERL